MANRPDLNPSADHLTKARWLVAEMNRHDGLAPLEVEKFHAEDALANQDPFGQNIPQCPLKAWPTGECVYAELGIPEDYWRYEHDEAWRLGLNKAYNDKAEKILGRRVLNEKPADPARQYPAPKTLADIFEAKNEWHQGSWWLQQSANDDRQLEALLDRVERRLENLAEFVLPPTWAAEKDRLTKLGVPSPLYRGQRGPCTFACSIFGPENILMLCLDNPALATRFSRTIQRAMLGLGAVLDRERGWTPSAREGRGFHFADDNCCLFNPAMYELFGYPILQAMFAHYAPQPVDVRYQHSDSAMAHLLPLLGRLNLNRVNFGPTVTVADIRRHLPRAQIEGQLAPYTLSDNEHERIVLEFLRDFDQAREQRGLVFYTAGSINNGSSLQSFRLIMSAIQHFGRYDR